MGGGDPEDRPELFSEEILAKVIFSEEEIVTKEVLGGDQRDFFLGMVDKVAVRKVADGDDFG